MAKKITEEKQEIKVIKEIKATKKVADITVKKIKNKSDIKDKTKILDNKFIISSRLTEKASLMSNKNVYTFNVIDAATKLSLIKEIQQTYKVKPIKITIINNPRTAVFVRGKHGYKAGFKKALVFLKKGDKINLV